MREKKETVNLGATDLLARVSMIQGKKRKIQAESQEAFIIIIIIIIIKIF